ncbi:hypothetical protein C5C24_13335 [Rathayibacter sp. AY2B3]|uniref:hypothetical protein n=1 Tax=Rathayibacter sp. AY2B3 TaxID=2080569 RepID=UPI000CE8FE93|nr:hypothetical protein [Rathayibacter sp. AY2B3]PPG49298.1 hypothetical protein C5C24_13335 [Rathayibacter sp. AY2B3]
MASARSAAGRRAQRKAPRTDPVEQVTSSTSEAAAPLRSVTVFWIAHRCSGTLAPTLLGFGVVRLSTLVH